MKDAIASFVDSLQQQKEQERTSLLDSLSPFLSLGPVNLSKVMDFLDAESMFNAEQASYTLSQIMLDYCLWDRLGTSMMMDTAAIIPSSHDDIPETYQTCPRRSNGTARFWKESKHETDLAHQSRHTGAMRFQKRNYTENTPCFVVRFQGRDISHPRANYNVHGIGLPFSVVSAPLTLTLAG
jgi:hypothetical protein